MKKFAVNKNCRAV